MPPFYGRTEGSGTKVDWCDRRRFRVSSSQAGGQFTDAVCHRPRVRQSLTKCLDLRYRNQPKYVILLSSQVDKEHVSIWDNEFAHQW